MVLALCAALVAAEEVCQSGTCLANGDTVCDRATGACPPCMYAISGGYSCYGKIGNACPYPDTLTICSPPAPATRAPVVTPAPAPVPTPPARIPTAATASAAPPAPTPAPPATTATPLVTVAPGESDSASKADATEAPTLKKTTSVNPDGADVGTVVPPTGDSQQAASPSSQTAPKATDPQNALAAENKAAPPKDSSKLVNIMIIAGAAIGVLVVVIFVVRRVRQRRDEPMNMGFDDLGFDKSPAHLGGGQAFSSAIGGAANGYDDFGESGHYTTTQPLTDKINFSTLEMAPVVASARSKSRRQSSRPSGVPSAAPSSVMLDSNQSELEFHDNQSELEFNDGQSELEFHDNQSELAFSVGLNSSTQSHQQFQHHIDDYNTPQAVFNRDRAKSRVRGIETSLIQNEFPELAGSYNSDVASIRGTDVEEFDIVDPGAIREGERRNTETLVADGRFRPLFSTASLADSFASSFVSNTTNETNSEYGNSVYI